jgi:hypothetical protein
MCLDQTRATFEFEKALILSTRARSMVLNVNIDETTCKVVAMYE